MSFSICANFKEPHCPVNGALHAVLMAIKLPRRTEDVRTERLTLLVGWGKKVGDRGSFPAVMNAKLERSSASLRAAEHG